MHLSWERNLGTLDRGLRIIVGLLLICLSAFQPIIFSSVVNISLWLFGIIMLVEGLLAY